jgi:hypothetical protein
VPLVLLLLLLPLVVMTLMPLLLVQRYRAGSARRQARPWAATLAIIAMAFSAAVFLASAAVTTIWFAGALSGAAVGMVIGVGLGAFGFALTRWEATVRSLHYTPNRWLVLLVTLVVSARILYGLFRSFQAATAGLSGTATLDAFGVPESLAAGAIVIGYHLAYNVALRWRIARWSRRALRPL